MQKTDSTTIIIKLIIIGFLIRTCRLLARVTITTAELISGTSHPTGAFINIEITISRGLLD
ncbi:hypothetical protein, partial [Pseudomonas viridiflava]|uniref:hypothetical protein n=1 Tax=Pseudomonas viridiflava TaxID=33069 RepID=UPI00197EA8DF